MHPQQGGKQFCFCTDGPLHLRMCLHPEAFRKKIQLPPHYFRYFDLRRRVSQFSKTDRTFGSLKEVLDRIFCDVGSMLKRYYVYIV